MELQRDQVKLHDKELTRNDLFINNEQQSEKALSRHVGTMRTRISDVSILYDRKTQERAGRWSEKRKRKVRRRFQLLRRIFKGAESHKSVINTIDWATSELKDCRESNLNAIYSHTKPFERTARSADLMHFNQDSQGKVLIFPVCEKRFAKAGNNFHLKRLLKKFLEKEFYRFDMKKSPVYISYLGEIEDANVIRELGQMACKTLAISLVDLPPHETITEFLEFADELDLKGVEEYLGHLVLPSSQVVVAEAEDYEITEKDGKYIRLSSRPMAIPTGPIMMGALLAAETGEVITGKPGRGIRGVARPLMEYDQERLNAAELAQKGYVMIGPKGKILGASTANESDREELHQFPKVDARNTIGKALIQFSNDTTFGKWGAEERALFEKKVKGYFNDKVREGVIESFSIENITFNTNTKRAEIIVHIQYKDIVEGMDFVLEGTPGDIDLQ